MIEMWRRMIRPRVPAEVRIPRVETFPFTLTEHSTDLTKTDTTANVETEHWNYRVPIRQTITIPAGSRIYMWIATSGATQITSGVVRIYKASADKITKRDLLIEASPDELDAGGTPEDKEKQYPVPVTVRIGPLEYLLCTVNASQVADDAQLKVRVVGTRELELD